VTKSCKDGQQLETAIASQMVAVYYPHQQWPHYYHLTPIRIDLFTVEQTAEWIRTFSLANGWAEASQYAQRFYQNRIFGHQLEKITLESLKYDLGITKYGHRLAIIAEVERVFPNLSRGDGKAVACSIGKSSSTMTNSVQEELEIKPEQTPDFFSFSEKCNTSNQDLASCNNTRTSQTLTVGTMTPDTAVSQDKDSNEFLNRFAEKQTDITEKDRSTKGHLPPLDEAHVPKTSSAEVLSFSVRKKSLRARPDNPLKYKALRNVWIRSGKSVRSDSVSYLTKGSVVVINQIKGRSGRVVVLQTNGDFNKVGWVTLYTHDRQQLMQKLNHNGQGERMIMHIM